MSNPLNIKLYDSEEFKLKNNYPSSIDSHYIASYPVNRLDRTIFFTKLVKTKQRDGYNNFYEYYRFDPSPDSLYRPGISVNDHLNENTTYAVLRTPGTGSFYEIIGEIE